MARPKKEVKQEEIVENEIDVQFENIPHKLNMMGQMINDAIGAIHATHIVEHGGKEEGGDPLIKQLQGRKGHKDEMNVEIKNAAQNVILRILEEYTFMLDNPELFHE